LAEQGRAAIIVPDGVLNAGGPGETIRRRLLEEFDVHTLLRLPTGIFYAAGVNANVLFFDRPSARRSPERPLWVYDFRTNKHFTLVGKRLERSDLDEFVHCYKPDQRDAREPIWSTENQSGRWRSFSAEEVQQRDRANFDLSWINDDDRHLYKSSHALEDLTTQIAEDLQTALAQISELAAGR
jgi:type I restriction enzyme M protein